MASRSERDELGHVKATAKMSVNIALIGISFTVFTLILTLKPELLKNEFLALQIVLSIPFLISSTLARMRHVSAAEEKRWESFGFVGFILAYSFLINSIGILLDIFASVGIAMVFFAVNIASAVVYSAIEVSYNRSMLKERLFKDLAFFLIILFLGIVPSFGL